MITILIGLLLITILEVSYSLYCKADMDSKLQRYRELFYYISFASIVALVVWIGYILCALTFGLLL